MNSFKKLKLNKISRILQKSTATILLLIMTLGILPQVMLANNNITDPNNIINPIDFDGFDAFGFDDFITTNTMATDITDLDEYTNLDIISEESDNFEMFIQGFGLDNQSQQNLYLNNLIDLGLGITYPNLNIGTSQRRLNYQLLLEGNYFAGELISRFEEMFGIHTATYIRQNFKTIFDISKYEIDEGLLDIIAPLYMVRAEQFEEFLRFGMLGNDIAIQAFGGSAIAVYSSISHLLNVSDLSQLAGFNNPLWDFYILGIDMIDDIEYDPIHPGYKASYEEIIPDLSFMFPIVNPIDPISPIIPIIPLTVPIIPIDPIEPTPMPDNPIWQYNPYYRNLNDSSGRNGSYMISSDLLTPYDTLGYHIPRSNVSYDMLYQSQIDLDTNLTQREQQLLQPPITEQDIFNRGTQRTLPNGIEFIIDPNQSQLNELIYSHELLGGLNEPDTSNQYPSSPNQHLQVTQM